MQSVKEKRVVSKTTAMSGKHHWHDSTWTKSYSHCLNMYLVNMNVRHIQCVPIKS